MRLKLQFENSLAVIELGDIAGDTELKSLVEMARRTVASRPQLGRWRIVLNEAATAWQEVRI